MSFLFILVLLAMVATLGVLMAGLVVMTVGGEISQKWSNRLMIARVSTQAVTILLLSLLFLIS